MKALERYGNLKSVGTDESGEDCDKVAEERSSALQEYFRKHHFASDVDYNISRVK